MWTTILVPHDFSGCADRAAALAHDVAKVHGARVVLLHVVQLPVLMADSEGVVGPPDTEVPMPARDYAMLGARTKLAELADRLGRDGVAVDLQVVEGDPTREIAASVARDRADLIVMGTHGRTGLAHAALGSVAETVVRTSDVPVLTVRVPAHG
ncbi:MAG TPA: universal stress protein [Kofleriaceae bacterium]|nr:universal stress protein [Kofleriaceae bacterium]